MVYCADGEIAHARQVAQDGNRNIVDPPTDTSFLTSDPSAFSLVVTKITDGMGDPVPVSPALGMTVPSGENFFNGPESNYPIVGASSANTNTFGSNSPPTPLTGTVVFKFGRAINGSLSTRLERWDHGIAGLLHTPDGADDNYDYGDADDPTDNDLAADISGNGDAATDPNENTANDQDTQDTNTGDDPSDGSAGDDSKIFTSGVDNSCSVLPSTTATASPAANASGWNKSTVTVKLTATDGAADALNAAAGSTVVDSASLIKEIDYTATNNNAAQTISGHINGATGSFDIATEGVWTVQFHATDIYGNSEATESLSVNPVQIDETAPSLNIAGVPATPIVPLCSSFPAHPSFSPSFNPTDPVLADGSAGSGVAFSGDSYTPSTTPSGAGSYNYSAHATDKADNTRSETDTWSVQYPYVGPLPPVPTSGGSFNVGRSVPVKFSSFCGNTPVTNVVARLYVQKGNGPLIAATSTSSSTTGNLFRYDPTGQQYIFNLATSNLSAGTWTLHTKLDDGTDHTVTIQLTS
jgi:hypothetical protein